MRAQPCHNCDFIYMGDEAPEEPCPSCGAEWGTPLATSLTTLDAPAKAPAVEPVRERRRFPRAFWLGVMLGAGAVALWGLMAGRIRPPARAAASMNADQEPESPRPSDDPAALTAELQALSDEVSKLQAAIAARDAQLLQSEKDRTSAEERYAATLANLQHVQSDLDQLRIEHEVLDDIPQQTFVRTWQVLGPLLNDDASGEAPSGEKVNLTRKYAGKSGEIRWRASASDSDKLDFTDVLESRDKAVALAACWVHSRGERNVKLSIGSDDGVRVWVNQQQVHEHRVQRGASPGQDAVETTLQSGWNEFLVEVDNIGSGEWCLFLEFRSPDDNQPLRLPCTNEPPSSRPRRSR